MFYLLFIALLSNALHACEIVEILYVEDSLPQRKITGKQVQAYNTTTLRKGTSFLENGDQTTLATLIVHATLNDRDKAITATEIINFAILQNQDAKIQEKLTRFGILENRDQVTLATLIKFLAERDPSTTYQVALGKLINLAIFQNEDAKIQEKLISFSTLEDGDQITLEILTGKNLVWCDIRMERVDGDIALENLIKKAKKEKFRLPPFIAVTSETLYYEQTYATEKGFILGHEKIKTQDHIKSVFQFCETTLGDSWLETHIGMPFPVRSSSRFSIFLPKKRNVHSSLNKVIPTDEQDNTRLDIPVAALVKKTAPVQKVEASSTQDEVVDFTTPKPSPHQDQTSTPSKHFKSHCATTVEDENPEEGNKKRKITTIESNEITGYEALNAQQGKTPKSNNHLITTITPSENQLSPASSLSNERSIRYYWNQMFEHIATLVNRLARLA